MSAYAFTIEASGVLESIVSAITVQQSKKLCEIAGVTGFIDNNDFDAIVGMDIIICGDFAISNYNRKTVVSFRIPSQSPPIDFRLDRSCF